VGSCWTGALEKVLRAVRLEQESVELLVDRHGRALDDVLDGPVELRDVSRALIY
jgi:hypothetical protein